MPKVVAMRALRIGRFRSNVVAMLRTGRFHAQSSRDAGADLGFLLSCPAISFCTSHPPTPVCVHRLVRSMPVVPLMPLRADERLPATVAAIEAGYLVESVLYPEDRTTGSSASETEHWRVPAVNGASSIIAISQAMLADPLSVTAPSPWLPAHSGARTASAAPLHTAALATLASGSTTRRPPAETNEATLGMWTTAALVQVRLLW